MDGGGQATASYSQATTSGGRATSRGDRAAASRNQAAARSGQAEAGSGQAGAGGSQAAASRGRLTAGRGRLAAGSGRAVASRRGRGSDQKLRLKKNRVVGEAPRRCRHTKRREVLWRRELIATEKPRDRSRRGSKGSPREWGHYRRRTHLGWPRRGGGSRGAKWRSRGGETRRPKRDDSRGRRESKGLAEVRKWGHPSKRLPAHPCGTTKYPPVPPREDPSA
jgi:hypothetical protein